MNIHVCLVSDQILANLIPALMERPHRVVIVASREMKQRGLDRRLGTALAAHGIESDIVDEAPDVSLAEIRRYAGALLEALREGMPDVNVTLNATGGTKLMMLGFVDAFRASSARLIYADTAHRRIEDIGRGGEVPMQNVLDVPGYLAAQGMRFDRADSDAADRLARIDQRATLTRFIGEHVVRLQAGIKILNGIVAKAIQPDPTRREDILANPDFDMVNGAWGDFAKLLERCDELGLVEWHKEARRGRFADLDAARYLSGIWLEEYAWLCARECRPFDVRMGVHRGGDDGDQELNEFDLLAVHCNQLLFIECKTANFTRQLGQANQVAYKLDSLGRQARGLFGQTWLLSAIEPPPELLERTGDMRITVLGPNDLPGLAARIADWMR